MTLRITYGLLLIACLLLPEIAPAQGTRVRGRVTDSENGEPLVGASVIFRHTYTGISTDAEGRFVLETRDPVDSIDVSLLGYLPRSLPVVAEAYNEMEIALRPETQDIDAILVTPGENPALPILEGVHRNKRRNDPKRMESYKCRTYTKMELDLSNIEPRFRNKRLQKSFGFVFENIDTSAVTGKTFLPVMISESSAEYYHRRSPALSREIILASRISGIDKDYTLSQFTGHLHGDVNFYDNYIDIFNVKFASPLSEHGTLYYNYFLVDSMRVENRKIYKIRFHPKRTSTPVLDGEVNIDSAGFALYSATAHMARGTNVNWLRHLVLESESRPVNDSVWFRKRDRIFADFSLTQSDSSKLKSFLGHREITYSEVEIGIDIPPRIERTDANVVIGEEVLKNDDSYWDTIRPHRLSEKEIKVYHMVDSIKKVPLFRDIYTLINTVFTGYYNTKYIGIGPYFKAFSFNRLEGARFQLGGRTTSEFSRKYRFGAYAAYGTKDGALKGGASAEFMFDRERTRKLTLGIRHDVTQLGASENALTESNILSSLLSRGDNTRLSMINEARLRYEHEWRHGLSSEIGVSVREILPNRYVPMLRPDSLPMSAVRSASLTLGLRLSWKETILRRTFDKYYMGTDYPVLSLYATCAPKGLLRNDYSYCRLEGSVQYRLPLPPIGTSDIVISGGKIFGQVPYPLLKLHEGNGTYFYDRYAFSCMNFYEFASDAWCALFYEHHFNGFFLGRIPLLKKLKWREIVTFKSVYGTLSARNDGSRADSRAILLFPSGMSSVRHPYMECGVGIENIFRILRIDAVWRLTHKDHIVDNEPVDRFALNCSIALKF